MTFEFEASNFGETQGYVVQLGTATILSSNSYKNRCRLLCKIYVKLSTTFRKQLMHVMGNNGNRDHAGYVLLPDATTSPQQRIL